ncbi:MAG: hypothetical protein Q9213_001193 [Squamulea squamosa]
MSLQHANIQPPPDGDTSTGPSILITTWLFAVASTIIVGLKIWTRLKIIQQFGADDVLTILALDPQLGHATIILTHVDIVLRLSCPGTLDQGPQDRRPVLLRYQARGINTTETREETWRRE